MPGRAEPASRVGAAPVFAAARGEPGDGCSRRRRPTPAPARVVVDLDVRPDDVSFTLETHADGPRCSTLDYSYGARAHEPRHPCRPRGVRHAGCDPTSRTCRARSGPSGWPRDPLGKDLERRPVRAARPFLGWAAGTPPVPARGQRSGLRASAAARLPRSTTQSPRWASASAAASPRAAAAAISGHTEPSPASRRYGHFGTSASTVVAAARPAGSALSQ